MTNKEELMEEAIKRMKFLGLHKSCIDAFKKEKVWKSEFYGALYECDLDMQKLIDEVEERCHGLVYHIIKGVYSAWGEQMVLYSFLYVPEEQEEWEYEWEDLKNGVVFGYVFNETDPNCSEFGTFYVAPSIGGLIVSNKPYHFG